MLGELDLSPCARRSSSSVADMFNGCLRNCPRCRRPRTASKQLAITRLPQILIVQLKRFTSYSSFSSKIETPVDFPVDKLELGYLLPPKSTSTKYRLNLPHETNTNYELYAVVNHLGGLNSSGHCKQSKRCCCSAET